MHSTARARARVMGVIAHVALEYRHACMGVASCAHAGASSGSGQKEGCVGRLQVG